TVLRGSAVAVNTDCFTSLSISIETVARPPAAAVAARMVPLALGSDGAGFVNRPALVPYTF
ncbi:TPA: hypothetical protein ACW5DI_003224, partial [Salmonella enterica subsp. enterica serovar Newport]